MSGDLVRTPKDVVHTRNRVGRIQGGMKQTQHGSARTPYGVTYRPNGVTRTRREAACIPYGVKDLPSDAACSNTGFKHALESCVAPTLCIPQTGSNIIILFACFNLAALF